MATGRNDPCPCGSGKKYKKCCLQKEVEMRGPGSPDAPYRQFQNLVTSIDEKVARMMEGLPASKGHEFMDMLENPPLLTESQTEEVFLDHTFSMRWDASAPDMYCRTYRFEDGSLPYAALLQRKSPKLTVDERDMLVKLATSKYGLYQIEEVFPETGRVRLRDLVRDTVLQAHDLSLSRTALPYTLFSSQAVFFPEKEAFVLFLLVLTSYPPEWKDRLLSQLDFAREFLGDEGNSTLSVADMLDRFPFVLYWVDAWFWYHITHQPLPKVFTKSGDPAVSVEIVYTCDNFAATLTALRKRPSLTEEVSEAQPGSEAEIASFVWLDEENSVLGSLELQASPCLLTLKAQSRKNANSLRQKLKSIPHLIEVERTEEPITEMLAEAHAKVRVGTVSRPKADLFEDEIPPELMAQLQKKSIDDLYNQSIPQLDGQTPAQAVKNSELRPKVLAWLEEMEHHYARGSGAMKALNADTLRKRLGL